MVDWIKTIGKYLTTSRQILNCIGALSLREMRMSWTMLNVKGLEGTSMEQLATTSIRQNLKGTISKESMGTFALRKELDEEY